MRPCILRPLSGASFETKLLFGRVQAAKGKTHMTFIRWHDFKLDICFFGSGPCGAITMCCLAIICCDNHCLSNVGFLILAHPPTDQWMDKFGEIGLLTLDSPLETPQNFKKKQPHSISSWWLNQPIWKISKVKLDHFPRDPGENTKCLSCHHFLFGSFNPFDQNVPEKTSGYTVHEVYFSGPCLNGSWRLIGFPS